ncbi:peptidoglycan DD-metalloendopeptidase family protein [Paracoccus sp. (in: a-proteobacteria)]|uniref:peptidoglycan DD-metalloendopeptidase family protein n=1 Tax=Paracoccus sp. TaxID=267 RepID=UPI0028A15D7B|nr:peptidoglycan DD-metalloendopeptidase family protein [Paracoccus sp. (in: a-proteobacteria)]
MIEIDPKFREMSQGARRRRNRMGVVRLALIAFLIIGAGWFGWHLAGASLMARLAPRSIAVAGADDQITQTESEFDIAPVVRGDTFTNIAGDPMVIAGPEGDAATGKHMTGPSDLSPIRVGPPEPDRLALISEDLYQRERRLIASLPTTREEFALFQAERSRERLMAASAEVGIVPGATVSVGQDETKARGSSMAFIRDPSNRTALWQDMVLQLRVPTDIAALLQANGFDRAHAERIKARMLSQMQIEPELQRGSVLALRYRQSAGAREVMQLSLYHAGAYIGSLAVGGSGQLVVSADPWADQPLLDQSEAEDLASDQPQFRLLDVIYSAAIRNGVPGPVIGEAIALMAKVHDLDAYAAEGDKLALLYATKPGPGADEAGQVLYIGVEGPSGEKRCYVVPRREGGYECYAPGARVIVDAGQPVLTPPVVGVLSQRFAPTRASEQRADAKNGAGFVIWRAAQGTPVVAALSGRVAELTPAAAGRAASLTLTHADGFTTRYDGLDQLPQALVVGADVQAGAAIGQIAAATAGGETGLRFQLMRDAKPVDPIPYLTGGTEVLASNAVEMLISRIIHVESGGNAAAKNPLSTATGLGQFIESTWMRMMRSYRPDLVATMGQQQLLDLRLEPDMSRQMVRHLAQENEAFLRARGHQITAGNLYLAHFLGPMGASQVLSADPALSVAQVMGQGVVSANPFLAGYSVADLRAWADRKMSARAVSDATAMPQTMVMKASPEVEKFVAQMNAILDDSAP